MESKHACKRCGDETPEEDLREDLCIDCFYVLYFYCESCSEVTDRDDLREADDNALCLSCFNDSYFYCDDCGDATSHDHRSNYSEDYDYCTYCRSDRNGLIEEYHTPPRCGLKFYGDDSDLFFGLEVEVEFRSTYERDEYLEKLDSWANVEYDSLHALCVPQEDGSLDSDYGVEIVFQPHTFSAINELMSKMPMPAANSFFDSYDVGIHVNMSRNAGSDNLWARFVRFIYLNREFWVSESNRSSSQWASIGRCMNVDIENPRFDEGKYLGVNMGNSKRVEVRTFKSIFDREHIIAYVTLCYDLFGFCQSLANKEFAELEAWDLLLESFKNYQKYKSPLKLFFVSRDLEYAHLTDLQGGVYRKVAI